MSERALGAILAAHDALGRARRMSMPRESSACLDLAHAAICDAMEAMNIPLAEPDPETDQRELRGSPRRVPAEEGEDDD